MIAMDARELHLFLLLSLQLHYLSWLLALGQYVLIFLQFLAVAFLPGESCIYRGPRDMAMDAWSLCCSNNSPVLSYVLFARVSPLAYVKNEKSIAISVLSKLYDPDQTNFCIRRRKPDEEAIRYMCFYKEKNQTFFSSWCWTPGAELDGLIKHEIHEKVAALRCMDGHILGLYESL